MANCVVNWRGKEIRFRTDAEQTFVRLNKILPWVHKRKFSFVTMDEQYKKVNEEISELEEACKFWHSDTDDEERWKNYCYEVADVALAIKGLSRFNELMADLSGLRVSGAIFYPMLRKASSVPLMIEKLLEVYFIRTYVNNRHI